MILIEASVEVLVQERGLIGINKQIERAGRTCYKSDHLIKEGSAEKFVERMMNLGHGAMLEHGTIYLYLSPDSPINGHKYRDNPYSEYKEVRLTKEPKVEKYITTNLRVLFENGWMDDLHYLCEPTEFHTKRYTIKLICDRAVSHQFVRHRVMSFAQESQRYCNYSKDKFDNQISFICPVEFNNLKLTEYNYTYLGLGCYGYSNQHLYPHPSKEYTFVDEESKEGIFLGLLCSSETAYKKMIANGANAEIARGVLPNATKTELIITGTKEQWDKFFKLRIDKHAHPDAQHCAGLIKDALGLWK